MKLLLFSCIYSCILVVVMWVCVFYSFLVFILWLKVFIRIQNWLLTVSLMLGELATDLQLMGRNSLHHMMKFMIVLILWVCKRIF